jgi:hypothetical protein
MVACEGWHASQHVWRSISQSRHSAATPACASGSTPSWASAYIPVSSSRHARPDEWDMQAAGPAAVCYNITYGGAVGGAATVVAQLGLPLASAVRRWAWMLPPASMGANVQLPGTQRIGIVKGVELSAHLPACPCTRPRHRCGARAKGRVGGGEGEGKGQGRGERL